MWSVLQKQSLQWQRHIPQSNNRYQWHQICPMFFFHYLLVFRNVSTFHIVSQARSDFQWDNSQVQIKYQLMNPHISCVLKSLKCTEKPHPPHARINYHVSTGYHITYSKKSNSKSYQLGKLKIHNSKNN